MEGDLYWLIFWDGQEHHVAPHRAETRQLALRHGLEFELTGTLAALISDDHQLTIDQMLLLATVLPPPGSNQWEMEH